MVDPHDPASGTDSERDAAFDAELRAALPEQEPPPGFAERTLAHRRLPRPRWQRLAAGSAMAGAALAASVAFVALATRDGGPTAGTLLATARETRDIGRATVVAEPGSQLAWTVDASGAARVQLDGGRAFFRVERGAESFVVDTPAGRVVVHGTCFTVELEKEPPMSTLAVPSRLPSAAAGAVLGAALSAAVVVTVHEGRVSVENDHGAVSAAAGDEVRADREHAPRATPGAHDRAELARTMAALAHAEQALQASSAASEGDTRALLDENTRLRRELDAQQSELRTLLAERTEDRGEAVPFPDDLPVRFTEGALLKAFQQGFADVGLKGEVSHIDCTEYPCIVFGKVESDTRDLMKKLQESPVFGGYGDDNRSVRGWAHGEGEPEEFAVVLTPKAGDRKGEPEGLHRRLGWRIDQGRAGSR